MTLSRSPALTNSTYSTHMIGRTGLIVIILSIFLTLGLSYDYITPLWSPPDEELHFAYCEYIARNHSLPDLQSNTQSMRVSQAFHPPLYYLMGSLFCSSTGKPIQEILVVSDGPGYRIIKHPKGEKTKAASAYWVRLFTLCLSTITIYYIYVMMLTIFPGDIIAAAAAALFAGTNPQFLHISASISNETLTSTLSTIYLCALLSYGRHTVSFRHALLMGFILGGCLLSKTSSVFLLPVTGCVMVFFRFRDWKKLVADGLSVFGVAAIVSGWWYITNWSMLSTMQTAQPWFLRYTPLSLAYLQKIISITITSFFGYFGSLQITITPVHLLFYVVLLLLGAVGLCNAVIKRELSMFQYQVLGILLLALLGGVGFFVLLNMKYYAFLGKYLFIVIAPIAIFTVTGLKMIVPVRLRNYVLLLTGCLLLLVNLDVLFRVLKPAYEETRLEEGASQPLFCCPTPELTKNTTVSQTFFSPEKNLCAVRVMFSCQAYQESGEITFTLRELKKNGKALVTMQYPLKKIRDFNRYFFIFPPIKDSRGGKYEFSLTASSVPDGKGVSLWYEANDSKLGGKMYVNNVPVDGALYFSAYCFTGDYPRTDWEGRRQLVINDGVYIYIPELQLYYEQSKEFRVYTTTHNKILLVEKAKKNRKLIF